MARRSTATERVPGNAAALLGARVVSVGVALVTTPFLFGMLGPREFGVWALLLGIVAMAGYADLGLGSAQVREVAQATASDDRRRAQAALAVGLGFYGVLSLVLLACVLAGWPAFAALFHLGGAAAHARDAALLVASAFALDALSTPWRAALEGSQRMRPIALVTAVAALVGGSLGVAFVAGGAGLVRIVPWHVLTAIFPVAAALHAEGDRALLDRLYLRATRYLALFACAGAAALVVAAEPLVELWIGRPLPLAATTVVLLAVAYAVNLTSGAAAAVTRAEGEPGRETRYALVAAGLNIALAVPLLLAMGPVGVPLATTVAYVLATAYFFHHFHRASGRPLAPLGRVVWKPFGAAGAAVVLTWSVAGLFPDPSGRLEAAVATASRAGLALALTTAALVALRFFEAEDRDLLARSLARVRVLLSPPVPATRGERP